MNFEKGNSGFGPKVITHLENEITRPKPAESFYLGQNEVLERLMKGESLDDILTHLTHIIEAQVPGMISSILIFNPVSKTLRHGAAPNLPKTYTEAIDGVKIGGNVGSCGTAAYRGELVVVEDHRIESPLGSVSKSRT